MSQEQADVAYLSHSQSWRQMTTAVGGRCVDFDGVCVAMTGIPSPEWNPGLVVGASVDPGAAITWGIQVRRDAGIPGGGYDVPTARYPELERVFTEVGHRVLVSRPMMVLPVDDLVAAPAPPRLDLRPVLDERDLEAFRDVQQRGFGSDPVVARASSPWETVRLTETAYVVGWVGDEPVTSALGVTAAGAVAIFGVTTVPEHRGNGYGRAVTAAVTSAGARMGAHLAWLQSSEMGRPVYAAMGFRAVEDYVVWAGDDG
jgi:GNAT superfamily N-acetyltransferase